MPEPRPHPASSPTPDPVRCCATCRHFAGVPLTCNGLGAPIPWADAIAPGGPCHGETAPRWEPRADRRAERGAVPPNQDAPRG